MYVGLASVIKNYLEHEKITLQMSLEFKDVDSLRNMSTYQPSNLRKKGIDQYLSALYVDNDPDSNGSPPILFEVSSSAILEIRGEGKTHDLSLQEINFLFTTAAQDVEDNNSIIKMLFIKFQEHLEDGDGSYANNFIAFIAHHLQEFSDDMVAHNRMYYLCSYVVLLIFSNPNLYYICRVYYICQSK